MKQQNDRAGLRLITASIWLVFILVTLNPRPLHAFMGEATIWHTVVVGLVAFFLTVLAWGASNREKQADDDD